MAKEGITRNVTFKPRHDLREERRGYTDFWAKLQMQEDMAEVPVHSSRVNKRSQEMGQERRWSQNQVIWLLLSDKVASHWTFS